MDKAIASFLKKYPKSLSDKQVQMLFANETGLILTLAYIQRLKAYPHILN